ncbi:MAG: hypothetical protein GY810_04080 [Aureispira sp.]|nr:hypothetical protein [Aureispira sp.]
MKGIFLKSITLIGFITLSIFFIVHQTQQRSKKSTLYKDIPIPTLSPSQIYTHAITYEPFYRVDQLIDRILEDPQSHIFYQSNPITFNAFMDENGITSNEYALFVRYIMDSLSKVKPDTPSDFFISEECMYSGMVAEWTNEEYYGNTYDFIRGLKSESPNSSDTSHLKDSK